MPWCLNSIDILMYFFKLEEVIFEIPFQKNVFAKGQGQMRVPDLRFGTVQGQNSPFPDLFMTFSRSFEKVAHLCSCDVFTQYFCCFYEKNGHIIV